MWVRGAPLIGVTASYGMFFAVKDKPTEANIRNAYNLLISTRPTAVDLRWALERILNNILKLREVERSDYLWAFCKELEENSIKQCSRIGDYGLEIIKSKLIKGKTFNILTHCNAGWLACVDWGTALAPIYQAHKKGMIQFMYGLMKLGQGLKELH